MSFRSCALKSQVLDTFSVSFNKNLVLIKYPNRLSGLHLHQFYIPEGLDG